MTPLSSFNQFGAKSEQLSQFAHRFHRDQTCFGLYSVLSTVLTFKFEIYLSDHAKTSPFDDCA